MPVGSRRPRNDDSGRIRGCRRGTTWICATAIACAVGVAAPVLPALGALKATVSDDATLLTLINQDRISGGLGAVTINGPLSAIAQTQAEAMASSGRLYQNPDFPADVPAANAAGENVGYGATAAQVEAAFVASPPHQAVLMDPAYRLVGIGTAPSSLGLMVVEEFVDTVGSLSAPAAPAAPAQTPAPAPVVAITKAPLPPVESVPAVKPAAKPVAAPAVQAPVQKPSPSPSPPPPPPPPPAPVAAPPPPPPPPTINIALYSYMLGWEQWQSSDTP